MVKLSVIKVKEKQAVILNGINNMSCKDIDFVLCHCKTVRPLLHNFPAV